MRSVSFCAVSCQRQAGYLPEIGPDLVSCGHFDEAAPETTAYYQSMLPGAETVIFEDASHGRQLEKPEEFPAVVRGFLKRIG